MPCSPIVTWPSAATATFPSLNTAITVVDRIIRRFYATISVVPNWADPRTLRIAAMVAAVALSVAAIIGAIHNPQAGAWLAVAALAMSIVAIVLITRLAKTAHDWGAELRRARRDLQVLTRDNEETEGLKNSILANIDRAIVVCSRDGRVRIANSAARDLFRAPAIIGMNLRHIALSEKLLALVDEALRSDEDTAISRDITIDYPEQRSLKVRAFQVDEDEVAIWIADVSELKRLETVRRDFVANVSHELRTPMASIRALAETIEDDPELTIAERDRYLDKIIAEVDRLTLLSEDLLILASAESKPATQTEIDLAEIARYAVQELEQTAAAKGLTLDLDAPPTLVALGDRPQIIQVALNLLQNAIRYTNIGGAKVRVYEDGEEAVLEVSDTGIGIAREHLPRIFERFYRVDAARSRATGGTGLGLAIVKHIVEGLGGRVEVESELNAGSVFRARLPL